MSRPTYSLTFPAFPGHLCKPVSALTPDENRALMAEVTSVYRAIMAALDAHTDAYPDTRQLAYIMAAHAAKLALEGEEHDPEPRDDAPGTLTEDDLAEVNSIFDPLVDILDAYVDTHPETWTFAAMHEALARAQGYLEDMERDIDTDIAAEEADA